MSNLLDRLDRVVLRLAKLAVLEPMPAATLFWASGVVLSLLSLLIGRWSGRSFDVLLGIFGYCILAVVITRMASVRAIPWSSDLGVLIGTVVISVVNVVGRNDHVNFSGLYFLVAIFAALYLRPIGVVALIAEVGVAYAFVLHLGPPSTNMEFSWVTMIVSLGFVVLVIAGIVNTLRSSSREDSLTGLANRGYWDGRLEEEIERAKRARTGLSVIMIDIDDFKSVNDQGGHEAGDDVLAGCDVLAGHQALNGTRAAHQAPTGDVVRTADANDVLAAVLPWTRLVAAPVDPAAGLPGPMVSVLGPVEITGSFDPLRPDQAELVLALALHAPLGLTDTVLCGLLGPDADHPRALDAVRGLVARTRDRLGVADDDRPYILSQGGGVYATHPDLALDWAIFSELAGRGLADEATDDLRAALSLVRGQPFGGRGSWWVDTGLIETMTGEIVDAAVLLSRLELQAGNPRAARRAARSGLAVASASERLWRALMSAEHASGSPAGVVAAWTGCLDAIARIDPGAEPDPQTRRLFGRLSGGAVSAGQ